MSALEYFWGDYISKLEDKYSQYEDDSAIDIEDLDSNKMVVQSTPKHTPGTSPQTASNKSQAASVGPGMANDSRKALLVTQDHQEDNCASDIELQCEGLETILAIIKRESRYALFLRDLIVKQLIALLGETIFELYLIDRTPINFIPLIKINKNNYPTVEFICKNIHSDEDYLKQLGCTADQISLSNDILLEVKEQHLEACASRIAQSNKLKPMIKNSIPRLIATDAINATTTTKKTPSGPDSRQMPAKITKNSSASKNTRQVAIRSVKMPIEDELTSLDISFSRNAKTNRKTTTGAAKNGPDDLEDGEPHPADNPSPRTAKRIRESSSDTDAAELSSLDISRRNPKRSCRQKPRRVLL